MENKQSEFVTDVAKQRNLPCVRWKERVDGEHDFKLNEEWCNLVSVSPEMGSL